MLNKGKFSKNVQGKVQITQEFTVRVNTAKGYEEKYRQGMKQQQKKKIQMLQL